MRKQNFLVSLACLMVLSTCHVGFADEQAPIDALLPEHIRSVFARLDDPSFSQREAAVSELLALGRDAIDPLVAGMESFSPEASVRAFDVLLRLYLGDDEQVYDTAERAFRRLLHVNNLAVTARAERVFESITEIREIRGIAKFIRLGGVIQMYEPNSDRHVGNRSQIKSIVIGREWEGGDEGVRLIESFQQVYGEVTTLIVVRGAKISEEILLDLRAELPFLSIQRRGTARLGVGSTHDDPRSCVIGSVEPDSSAARAGIEPFDQIIKIDGEPIADFETLVKVIYDKEPGDRVPIVYSRRGRVTTVEVELLPWPKDSGTKAPIPKR